MAGEITVTIEQGDREWRRVFAYGPGREFETETAANEAIAAWQPHVDELHDAMQKLAALDDNEEAP